MSETMEIQSSGRTRDKRVKAKKDGRIRDVLLLSALALLLLLAVWKIFYTDGKTNGSEANASVAAGTENEQRLCALLKEIDGVGEVRVMICEDENGFKSVVVVCEGAENLRVNMDVREAAATALGTEEKYVKIYPMK